MNIVDPKLAAEFEAQLRAQYARMTDLHGVAFATEYAEEFVEWLKARQPVSMFDEFEEHLRQMAVIKVSHPHLADIGDGLLEAADRLARMREDVARFEWVLPVVCGDDTPIANARTHAMGLALMNKLEGREAIDAARKEAP
jgi:hypothetical protein